MATVSTRFEIVPLVGVLEIGKNMTAYNYGGHIMVVDTGLMFRAFCLEKAERWD